MKRGEIWFASCCLGKPSSEKGKERKEGDAGLAGGVEFVAAGRDLQVPFAVPDIEDDLIRTGDAVRNGSDELGGEISGKENWSGREDINCETT